VNGELEGLDGFVEDAVLSLSRGGRLVVISFHSLEDRIVKRATRALAMRCICPPGLPICGCGRENLVHLVNARPIAPSPEERARNPRSRSAKLRAVERL
jgi:16S rRNA (cytosine1402-N4)-methyltransferase